jgi:hypothetical protein
MDGPKGLLFVSHIDFLVILEGRSRLMKQGIDQYGQILDK